MSLPPNVIRVKRKRVDEAPVTFLQFDKGPKRHRSDADWVYQRRDNTKPLGEAVPREEVRPVIHVSKPKEDKATASRPIQTQRAEKDEILQRKILTPKSSLQSLSHEPRRFHISRSTMSKGSNLPPAAGVSKKGRASPIVFAERSRKRNAERALKSSLPSEASSSLATSLPERALKKPGTPRNRSPVKGPVDGPHRAPLPDSLAKPHQETMDKIATDMNQWVLNEIGANLHDMDVKKKQQQQVKLKYRPKVPAKSYAELYPEPLSRPVPGISKDVDMAMSEASEAEDDDGDWVIDEYIRVPVHTVKVTMNPSDVGVLVLDGEEDNVLFYGADDEEEDDFLEDDEDENAENHYTADYPEDEVDSEDEYNRNAYLFRHDASDDEEFDATGFAGNGSDSDDGMILEGNDGENDDVTMARIKRYMQRKHSNYG